MVNLSGLSESNRVYGQLLKVAICICEISMENSAIFFIHPQKMAFAICEVGAGTPAPNGLILTALKSA